MFRKLFPKIYRPHFTWEDTIDSNIYRIMRDGKWFAMVHLNGEMWLHTHEKHMDYIVKNLNKLSYIIK